MERIPQSRYRLSAHTPRALQVERRICTITKPAHVNGACLSAPQHRQSCQSSLSRVPLIWPRSNARRDMTGGPSAMGITRLAEMRQTNLSSSPATLILFFPLLFPFHFQPLLNFFFSCSHQHILYEVWTYDSWAIKEAFLDQTLLEIYLEELLQILSPRKSWLTHTILVTIASKLRLSDAFICLTSASPFHYIF